MPSSTPFSLLSLGPIINRWKYLVGAALALALVGSLVVALLLPNIYQSTAVFYPTNLQSADPDRLVEGSKLEISTKGEDLDRIITIGTSQLVAELIIKRFDLFRHYQAGTPGDDKAENYVLYEFNANLDIVHNDRDAIELTFRDPNKRLAARVANAMVEVIDSLNQQLTLENRRQILTLYKQRYDYFTKTYEQSRQQLVAARRRYGIFGLSEFQGRYLAQAVIEAEANLRRAEAGNGNVAAARRAVQGLTRADGGNLINLESYTAGNDSVTMFVARVADLQTRLTAARSAYEIADLALKSRISSLYKVQQAYPATRKIKPVRWLIVAGSVFLTFALSLIVITLLELYRRVARPAGERVLA
ncbi:hypothetical protein [uncultured Hymenobacter sp.]|uniref:hypothetical protein n=1 Tax=uncultured Hymenobacter sp. TaxID=170016 RepID=UPI0035C9BF9A